MNHKVRPLFTCVVLILLMALSFLTLQSTHIFIRSVDAASMKPMNQGESSTEEPTNNPDSASTENPTASPEPTTNSTDTPTPEPTAETTSLIPIEATTEIVIESTVEATETDIPGGIETTPAVMPDITEEATASAAEITVVLTCQETGMVFEIANIGGDMLNPVAYTLTLDDTAGAPVPNAMPPDFMLLAGESVTLEGGFGHPSLIIGETTYQPETPCEPPAPPRIDVLADCTFETGVIFTITNSGGAMTAEQAYSIARSDGETVTGTFLLEANEKMTLNAGYDQPMFSSGEIGSTLDTPCDAPAMISGSVWNDADVDGTRGAAETGIADMTVALTDATGYNQSVQTAADGSYVFALLPASLYTVQVDATTLSSDFTLTSPAEGFIILDIQPGENHIADFGYTATPSASVSGVVWLETINYGVRDGNEMGIAGAMVELVDRAGVVVAVAPVDAVTGAYQFTEVPAGSYTVRLDQSSLFAPNGVTWNSDEQLDYETSLTLNTGDIRTGIDFGIVGTF